MRALLARSYNGLDMKKTHSGAHGPIKNVKLAEANARLAKKPTKH